MGERTRRRRWIAWAGIISVTAVVLLLLGADYIEWARTGKLRAGALWKIHPHYVSGADAWRLAALEWTSALAVVAACTAAWASTRTWRLSAALAAAVLFAGTTILAVSVFSP
jgi:hypothetical protein